MVSNVKKKAKVRAHVAKNQNIEDIRHIMAITEGGFGKPVTRSGRFINANHPPEDATKDELEAIARFWGDPEDFKPIGGTAVERNRQKRIRPTRG